MERATHRRVSGKAERHVSRPFAFWPFPRGFSPISPLSPLGPRVRKDIAALPSASACAAKTPSQTLRVLKRSCPNQLPLFERWIGPHVAGARIRLPGSLPRNCLETASKLPRNCLETAVRRGPTAWQEEEMPGTPKGRRKDADPRAGAPPYQRFPEATRLGPGQRRVHRSIACPGAAKELHLPRTGRPCHVAWPSVYLSVYACWPSPA